MAAGRFWISTHPDTTAAMAQECAAFPSDLTEPSLAEELRAILQA